ncbi:unnamed protein product, partial [Durusdinium trenchii]
MADPEQTKSLEDAASDEEDGWPEGECGLCNQKFQSQDDAVDGAAMTVTPCKGVNKGECLRCFYIRRGSFKNVESGMLRGLLKKNANLRDKFRSLRKKHIRITTRSPGTRPRHESIDVRHFTEKKNEAFVDIFEEGEWMSISDYIDTKIDDEKIKKKLKTQAQKRAYVTNDDMGVDGVIILPNAKVKKVRMGSRVSSAQLRREEHADGQDAKAAAEKNKICTAMDEEETAALGDMPEAEEEELAQPDESEGEGSDDGMFGFAGATVKAATKPQPKRRAREVTSAPGGPVPGSGTASGSTKPEKRSEETVNAKIAKAVQAIDFMKEVSGLAIWQGAVKEKDLSSKLSKYLDLANQLDGATTNVETAKDHAKALYDRITAVNTVIQCLDDARLLLSKISKDCEALESDENRNMFQQMVDGLPDDCKNTVLTDVGRKLTEACFQPGSDGYFWDFVKLDVNKKEPKPVCLSSALPHDKASSLQQQLVNGWMDRIDDGSDTDCLEGFSVKLLLDLHRFVAVGNVMEHTAGNIVLDKRTVKEIKAAVGFSQRVSTLWQATCDIAKSAIDETKVVSEGGNMANNLKELISTVQNAVDKSDASKGSWDQIKLNAANCGNALAYLDACQESKEEGAQDALTALKAQVEALTVLMGSDTFSSSTASVSKHLQDLWLAEPGENLNLPCREKKDVMLILWKVAVQGLILSGVLRKDVLYNSTLSEFAIALHDYGKEEKPNLKASCGGPEKAVQAIQKDAIELGPDLDKALGVLRQAQLLQSLSSSPDDPLPQQAKTLLTIDSLEIENIKFFFPDVIDTLTKFRAKAHENMAEGLGKVEEAIKNAQTKLC